MSRNAITINLVAGGNILPQSFVKLDTSANEQCLQAGAGDTPVGISGNWTRYAGGTPADDGLEAVATEFPPVFGVGCVVPLVCGATGTWTAGVFLKPDSLGYGTPVTDGTDVAGAVSLTAANPGEAGRVVVINPGGQGYAGTVPVVTLSGNTTLTANQSGALIVVNAADKTLTTPAGTPGLRYKVMAIGNAVTAGTVGTTLHVPTGDTLAGNGFTAASGKGAIDTKATPAVVGDFIEITCTAANTWVVTEISGTWDRES